jgi:hypothetical protein
MLFAPELRILIESMGRISCNLSESEPGFSLFNLIGYGFYFINDEESQLSESVAKMTFDDGHITDVVYALIMASKSFMLKMYWLFC